MIWVNCFYLPDRPLVRSESSARGNRVVGIVNPPDICKLIERHRHKNCFRPRDLRGRKFQTRNYSYGHQQYCPYGRHRSHVTALDANPHFDVHWKKATGRVINQSPTFLQLYKRTKSFYHYYGNKTINGN